LANDAENALCALREATAALRNATHRRTVQDSGIDKAELVADLARNLEALAALVRTTGLEPIPTTPASHNLHAVVQGVSATAAMARRLAASTDGHHPVSQLTEAPRG
jgi:hypothetical protein